MGTCCASTEANGRTPVRNNGKAATPSSLDKYIRYPDEICANDFNAPQHEAIYRDSIEN